MLKNIKLSKNKLSCFHYNTLTESEQEFIIFHIDAVKFLNEQIKFYNSFSEEQLSKYSSIKKEYDTLKSIIEKLDIFNKH